MIIDILILFRNFAPNMKIVVDDKIILELKSVSKLVPAHSAQLINYLTITKLKVGLLLNFGEGRDYKRVYLKDKVL